MSVNAKIDVSIGADYKGTVDFGTLDYKARVGKIVSFTPGTANTNQANLLFTDSRSLADGASENLDLAGSLTDVYGTSLTFGEVTTIYVTNSGTTDITVGGAASNAFVGPFGAAAHTVTVKPGEVFLVTSKAGWAVTAGTGDILKVANAAGAAGVYDIVVIGRTVAV